MNKIQKILQESKDKTGSIKLDLACGSSKREDGYIGVDISEDTTADIIWDLNQYPWPFEDNSIDEIYCSNYVEHIPHDIQNGSKLDGLIQFMNECYRILKPDGKMTILAPYYTSMRAYGDPTHVRFICDFTFYYYNKEWRDSNKLSHYGITTDFDAIINYHVNDEMALRSETVRNKAFQEDWNAIDDIMVELTKRK